MSSENLDKYEYLTGEDLNYNQVLLNKKSLVILPWVNFLINNWKKKSKKGLLKTLKNIEDKHEEQLKEIKNQKIRQLNVNDRKTVSLKTLWFMTKITNFTNTDWVNLLKYYQLNLNLIR